MSGTSGTARPRSALHRFPKTILDRGYALPSHSRCEPRLPDRASLPPGPGAPARGREARSFRSRRDPDTRYRSRSRSFWEAGDARPSSLSCQECGERGERERNQGRAGRRPEPTPSHRMGEPPQGLMTKPGRHPATVCGPHCGRHSDCGAHSVGPALSPHHTPTLSLTRKISWALPEKFCERFVKN